MRVQAGELAAQGQVLRKHESFSDIMTKQEARLATHSRVTPASADTEIAPLPAPFAKRLSVRLPPIGFQLLR
jgi:hypothetical protein